jgi:hypothetical protein
VLTPETGTRHLWEYDHPYYCAAGNFHVRRDVDNAQHVLHDSWSDFMDTWGTSDHDLNLVFRWDWSRADPSDYEPGEDVPGDTLELFVVLQRKADLWSHTIAVTEADEPAVREWLAGRAKTITAIWEPIALTTEAAAQ